MKWVNLISIILVLLMSLGGCESDNPASSGTVTLTIVNALEAFTIYNIYVSPSGNRQWGIDRLGSQTLSPGESGSLELSKGDYDIKIIDQDGDEYFKWGLKLNSNYTWRVRLSDLSG